MDAKLLDMTTTYILKQNKLSIIIESLKFIISLWYGIFRGKRKIY
jgi:hypothetical protein